MATRGLRLVAAPRDGAPGGVRNRRAAIALGLAIPLVTLVAGLLGAGRARHPIDARAIAERAVLAAIDAGARAPEVRDALVTLRREIARRPLDAPARAAYAGLLLELASSPEERRAAALHAGRAAAIAPVTVPVIETAARVLARSGDAEKALDLTREMFRYDPPSAARLLAVLEPLLDAHRAEKAIPPEPAAWAAWIGQLNAAGRLPEAEARLARAGALWPKDPWVRLQIASRLAAREDWEGLAKVLPPGETLAWGPGTAPLLAFRGRLRAATGDRGGALRDAQEAVRLADGDAWIRLQAGMALEASGDLAGARGHWERGLFLLPGGDGARSLRTELLLRLARLDEREGRPADALRAWRSILELDPRHAEAQRRVDELSGFRR